MTPNAEHYHDPTADQAVKNADREKKMLTVQLDPEAVGPIKQTERAGFSLYTPVDIHIAPRSRAIVDTGIRIRLPTRTVGFVKGTLQRLIDPGLLVPDITIGEGYRDKIQVVLFNTTDQRIKIAKRTEIAAFYKYPNIDWTTLDIMAEIKTLPSAQRKGKWIHKPELGWGETWVCSECGEKTTSTIMGYPRYKWCPMCETDMRGEKE